MGPKKGWSLGEAQEVKKSGVGVKEVWGWDECAGDRGERRRRYED